MTKNPITTTVAVTVRDAMRVLRESTIRHLPVVDGQRRVMGMLSDRDLQALCVPQFSAGEYFGTAQTNLDAPVADVMTANAIVVRGDAPATQVIELMLENRVGAVLVIGDDRTLLGIVSYLDVLRCIRDKETVASEIMTRSPRTIESTAPMSEAIEVMQSMGVRHLPVVDDDGYLAGIVSDRDLGAYLVSFSEGRSADRARAKPSSIPTCELMTADVVCVDEDSELEEIADEMVQKRIGAVPVVDGEGRVVGIVSYVDILRRALGDLTSSESSGAGAAY